MKKLYWILLSVLAACLLCVGIYSVLVHTITVSSNLHSALWQVMAYTVLLCFALFNTASISRSVLSVH